MGNECLTGIAFEHPVFKVSGFDGWDSVAILYTGNIATKEPGALFNVALGKFLFLAHCAEAVADNHGSLLHWQNCLATSSQ